MEQAEHIELLIKASIEQSERARMIQTMYQKYFDNNDDDSFTEMITILDAYSSSWIRKELWKTGCYNDENEHFILQEARFAIWEKIMKDRDNKVFRDSFTYYAFGIYKNKTLDVIRKLSRKRSKFGDDLSLDESFGDTDNTLGDYFSSKNINEIEEEEKKEMYERLFYIYCLSLMNYNTFPPRSLALYYARILPHMMSINHNIETIPDSKATSAKWAFEKMGKRTIGELKIDSETTLQSDIAEDLQWCNEFVSQLEEYTDIENTKKQLKNIVYTSVYNKGKIEDWADYMHKAATKSAISYILKEPELLDLIKEYISQKDVLYNFVKGGKGR